MRSTRERSIARIAHRRHGLVSRRELLALGFNDDAILRRLRAGRLHVVHPAVYAVGHRLLTREGVCLAAVLACGDGAVLSHVAAAQLWDLLPVTTERPSVTVRHERGRAVPGVRVHRTRRLPDEHVSRRSAIPVTSVERTIADLAGVASSRRVERALSRAEALGLVDVPSLLNAIRHRTGAPVVRALLEEWTPRLSRSELEERLLGLIVSAGLPRPQVNTRVAGFEVDLCWRAARLVVEADGHAFHGSTAQIERDRRREAVLAARGFAVLRFTWRQATQRPHEVTSAIESALARGIG